MVRSEGGEDVSKFNSLPTGLKAGCISRLWVLFKPSAELNRARHRLRSAGIATVNSMVANPAPALEIAEHLLAQAAASGRDLENLKSSALKKLNKNTQRFANQNLRKLRFVKLELAVGILSVFDCVNNLRALRGSAEVLDADNQNAVELWFVCDRLKHNGPYNGGLVVASAMGRAVHIAVDALYGYHLPGSDDGDGVIFSSNCLNDEIARTIQSQRLRLGVRHHGPDKQ
jgi:hypothetical protein